MCNFKKTVISLLFFFMSVQLIFGQEPASRIEKLQLGQFNSSLSLSGSAFGTEVWGRYSNDKYYPWCTVFENPAFISGERSPKILLQFSPAQNFGFTQLSEASSIFNKEIDKSVVSYKAQDLTIGYPSINLKLKRKLNWPEGMVLFPVKNVTVGLLFHRSLSLSTLVDFIGNETSISTELSSGGVSNKVILNNYLDAVNRFDYFSTSTSFIITKLLNEKFISGLQVERLFSDLYIAGNWNIQGSMLYNGKEYLFNDPETLWPTDITQDYHGHFKGVGWKINWGGNFIINSKWILDGTVSYATNTNLKGRLTGNRNIITALALSALGSGGDIDEILVADQLNPSQLTYTENKNLEEHTELIQSMPNQVKIGLLFLTGKWGFYLSDRLYFGSYRLKYGTDYVELIPKHRLKLYINRGGFYSKLGVFFLEASSPVTQDLSINSGLLSVPLFCFGYSRKISRQFIFNSTMEVSPIPGVNFGFQYQF
ncbi:hypothetical protein H8E88_14265 [candidate division KSB1 bacterium]|nr:hypothetical protein [candidate division KSB1 bacterium]